MNTQFTQEAIEELGTAIFGEEFSLENEKQVARVTRRLERRKEILQNRANRIAQKLAELEGETE